MVVRLGARSAATERIDHQWNGRSRGANPAVTDARWHRVRVVHLPATGEIAVYVDGHRDPLLTAKDTTFGSGRAHRPAPAHGRARRSPSASAG
ncbi:hypothetical protein ACWER9_08220 [Micromonospora sp. NPDC003944]